MQTQVKTENYIYIASAIGGIVLLSVLKRKKMKDVHEFKVSQSALNALKKHEGLRLQAYQDVGGLWTIGYGHLINQADAGEKLKYMPPAQITLGEAEKLFMQDVNYVAELPIKRFVKVPLNQNQYDALVSFVFNVGSGNFQNSTLLRKLNDGNYSGAANEFTRWNKVKGKEIAGLTKRRIDEKTLFLS